MLNKVLTVALLSMSCLNASELNKSDIISQKQLNDNMNSSVEQKLELEKNEFKKYKNEYEKMQSMFNDCVVIDNKNSDYSDEMKKLEEEIKSEKKKDTYSFVLINNEDIISTSSDSDNSNKQLKMISEDKIECKRKQEKTKHTQNTKHSKKINKKQKNKYAKNKRNIDIIQKENINNMKAMLVKQQELVNNINSNKQKINKIQKNENSNSWWNFGKNLMYSAKNAISNIGSGITNLVWNSKKENKVEDKINLTSSIKEQSNNIVNNTDENSSWYKNIGNTVANGALDVLSSDFVKQNILVPEAVYYGLTIGACLALSPAQLIVFNMVKPAATYAINNLLIGEKKSTQVKTNVAMYNEDDFVVVENNVDNITKAKDKDGYKVIELKADNQNENSWKPFGNDNFFQKSGNILMNNGVLPIVVHSGVEAAKMLFNGPAKLVLNLFQSPVEYALNNLVKSNAKNIEDNLKQATNNITTI